MYNIETPLVHGIYQDIYGRMRTKSATDVECRAGIYTYADFREIAGGIMHETDKHQCHVEVCSGYMDKTGNGADGRQGCKVT